MAITLIDGALGVLGEQAATLAAACNSDSKDQTGSPGTTGLAVKGEVSPSGSTDCTFGPEEELVDAGKLVVAGAAVVDVVDVVAVTTGLVACFGIFVGHSFWRCSSLPQIRHFLARSGLLKAFQS